MVAPTRIRHPALTGPLSLAASLAIAAASGCGASPVVTTSEGTGTVVTASVGLESVVFAALEVREHQRLAHDLYDELSRRHVEPSLRLARDSRRQAMDSLGRLLRNRDSFNVIPSLPRGQYDDPSLTAEYTRLLPIGLESPAAAFRVAALLEERDMALVRQYGSETAAGDVTGLYSRLERANRTHLSAFVTRLRVMGEAYTLGRGRSNDLQALLDQNDEE